MSTTQRDPVSSAVRSATPDAIALRVSARRAARRADNRSDILDAAERIFAEYGIAGGSVRKIGADSGFSAAAIYTFFDSKQDLLVATLVRRAEELVDAMRKVVDADPDPLLGLHQIIDLSIELFGSHASFGQLLRGMRGGVQLAGESLDRAERAGDFALFHEATAIITDFIRAGQRAGTIRTGDPSALAHLYEVILNEHISGGGAAGRLAQDELHEFLGAALRRSS